MPELITVCWAHGKPYQAIYSVQSEMEIFNPSEPRVYSVMDALLREVKERFPSNYVHLGRVSIDLLFFNLLTSLFFEGMDEVYDKCWYVYGRAFSP